MGIVAESGGRSQGFVGSGSLLLLECLAQGYDVSERAPRRADLIHQLANEVDAEAAHLEVRFPYFLELSAEDGPGMARYECRLHGSLQECDDLVMELNVPITLPESMGRWGYAQVSVRFNEFIWLEDLISKVQQAIRAGSERSASVESLCGQLGDALKATSEISWFRVEVENLANGCSTFATVESTLS